VPVGVRARILALTRVAPPAETGLSHWSSRQMAAYVSRTEGVSASWHYVAKLWRDNDLRPHRQGTFKISRDPWFADKVSGMAVWFANGENGPLPDWLPIVKHVAKQVATSATALVATAVCVMGCSGDRFDPHAQEVDGPRQERTAAVTSVAASLFDGLPRFGAGSYDSCEAGQDNFMTRDDYRTRCGFSYRAVAGLAAKTTPAAIDEARHQVKGAGCTGTGSTDRDRIQLRGQADRSVALWGGAFSCGGLDLDILIGLSADATFAAQVGKRLPGPAGITVSLEEHDATKAFADASASGHGYVLVVDTGGDYYVEPREDE
jgi:hypothetical protein